MIRLGSLAGYSFEGPRALAGWTPPAKPAVYAILAKSNPDRPQEFSVIFVGHSDDLTTEGQSFRHARSNAWIKRADGKYNLHVAWLEVPGGTRAHRETDIARELDRHLRAELQHRQIRQGLESGMDRRVRDSDDYAPDNG